MTRPVARIYLKNVRPACALPATITEKLTLHASSLAPAIPNLNDPELCARRALVLDVHGVEGRLALQWAISAIISIRLASRCGISMDGYWVNNIGYMPPSTAEHTVLWGHYSEDLTEEAVQFSHAHLSTVEMLVLPEVYSRVSNAMRLYNGALILENADLALLGFVGAIESLFSIAPQELSFRLSLLLAKFLGEDPKAQRAIYNEVRALYTTRSKIAHGDKIEVSEEAAAIQIVETWTPKAEKFARLSLKRALEHDLVAIFNNKGQHEALLTALLFEPSLNQATGAIGAP